MIEPCVALTWDKTEHDYTPCSADNARAYRMEGLLLAVTVNLCKAHFKYFDSRPPGWGSVKIERIKESK